jgi:hypothetical protein
MDNLYKGYRELIMDEKKCGTILCGPCRVL